ncbi:MAG TPA: ribosomal-processing cysteine protease Prp [Symbiobacteriaceae bacterium]|nr:ribosomal-processing cysteine protease Prp [Symbiobacteriaceae bacterium]
MTKVQVRRAPDGTIAEIRVTGHAGYADPGEDIVCAGISALTATALLALDQIADHPHEGKLDAGLMSCKLRPGGTPESFEKAQTILATLVLGLRDIAKDYPKFIRVTEGG